MIGKMKYLLSFFILLISFVGWGQKYSIRIQSTENAVEVNEVVKIIVTTDIKGKIEEKWPVNFQKNIGSSSSSKFVQDPKTGTLVQEHTVTFSGTFSKAGNYKIGPFVLDINGNKYQSNTINISIGSNKNNQLANSNLTTYGFLSTSKNVIYEGEPVLLQANLYSNTPKGRILLHKDYSVFGDPDFFELNVKNEWLETTIGGKKIWGFNFGNKLLYPLSVDKLSFTPFQLQYASENGIRQVTSNIPSVKVLHLPSPSPDYFYGAVGEFSVQQYSSTTNLRQGDVIPIEITLSGIGNFHQLQKPKLELPQGVVGYGEVNVKELFEHSENGTKGKVIYQYHIQILDAGKIELPNFKYSYFSPEEEKYIQITDSNTIRLNVLTNNEYQKDIGRKKEMLREGQIAHFTTIEPSQKEIKIIEYPWYWLLLILPPCVCFFFVINSIQHNSFLEQKFARFKRKPNKIKDRLNKVSLQTRPWPDATLKEINLLIEDMIIQKINSKTKEGFDVEKWKEALLELGEENETIENIELIFEILNQNRYAFNNQESTEGLLEEIKNIALLWKQI